MLVNLTYGWATSAHLIESRLAIYSFTHPFLRRIVRVSFVVKWPVISNSVSGWGYLSLGTYSPDCEFEINRLLYQKIIAFLRFSYFAVLLFYYSDNRRTTIMLKRILKQCILSVSVDFDWLGVVLWEFHLLCLKLRTAVGQWLRRCATNRNVAVSFPDGVIGILHWQNPSDRTMALGSAQPVIEMSTGSISWGQKAAGE